MSDRGILLIDGGQIMKLRIFSLFTILFMLIGCTNNKPLPAPEEIEGYWARFKIDKNINVFGTLDNYLFREDVVYRDTRMLVDPALYENVGGDRFLSGFIKGFSVVPYPYLATLHGLPPAVGDFYEGPTLFTYDGGANYTANYVQSMDILLSLFPQDKSIFVMCGGGGYAMMTKDMLIALGWSANKIYNVGCYWSYEGDYDVRIKETSGEDDYYAFHLVDYKLIDFDYLTPIN